jgi:hypothetical protein
VHLDLAAAGFVRRSGVRASFYFDDDPALSAAHREEAASDGGALATRFENAEGVRTAELTWVLAAE